MKASTIFISVLAIILLIGMFLTNVILRNEYQKIDLNDPFKNYVSIEFNPYSVLDISGSNGYPIEITSKEVNDVKVLRSRLQHFKSEVKNDTLFIKFKGSNVPMEQSFLSTTPSGIIIHKKILSGIQISGTHNRIYGYSNQKLDINVNGKSYTEVSDVKLNNLNINMYQNSQIVFRNKNQVDSLKLNMNSTSIANLEKIEFKHISHKLSDSITLVLSKNTFNNLVNKN